MSLCAQRCVSGWLMRTVQSLGDDNFGEVWLARNAGWLDGVGCERGGDDALAALAEVDAHDTDEGDVESKAAWVRAKACVGVVLLSEKDESTLEEGLKILRQCADADDWIAAGELGTLLLTRKDIQQCDGECIKLLEKSAALGNVLAMHNLGTAYEDGLCVQKDKKKAFEWWKRAIDHSGYPPSASVYFMHQRGSDDFDESKAFHCCAIAADSGDPTALNNLGYCYENGLGVARNPEKAFSLFRQAYSLSQAAMIMSNLGRCYVNGIGTKPDVNKGVELLNKAIEMGETKAMTFLANLLHSGAIIQKDEQRSRELFERAAELGNAHAKAILPLIHGKPSANFDAFQNDGVPPFYSLYMLSAPYQDSNNEEDQKIGFEYLQRACQECERLDKVFFQEGNHCDQRSSQTMLSCYAAVLSELGRCYEEGRGVSKDEKKAFKCYNRGSSLNDPSCMVSLGICYENGIGVEMNTLKALDLYRRALILGNQIAEVKQDDTTLKIIFCKFLARSPLLSSYLKASRSIDSPFSSLF